MDEPASGGNTAVSTTTRAPRTVAAAGDAKPKRRAVPSVVTGVCLPCWMRDPTVRTLRPDRSGNVTAQPAARGRDSALNVGILIFEIC